MSEFGRRIDKGVRSADSLASALASTVYVAATCTRETDNDSGVEV